MKLMVIAADAQADAADVQAFAFSLLRDKIGPLLITFECTSCGCQMETEDDMQGQWIECIDCGADVEVPQL